MRRVRSAGAGWGARIAAEGKGDEADPLQIRVK